MSELPLKQNENIIADRSIRDKCAEHYEVLEKVKELLLISGTDFAVIAQVADYYGTGLEAIASLVKDNREELLEIPTRRIALRGNNKLFL